MRLTEKFCVFDTESTGPDPHRDRVIQMGWARFSGGLCVGTGAQLIDPGVRYERGAYVMFGQDGVGVTVPKGAYEVHGIAASDLVGQPKFADFAPKLDIGPVVVTYNGLWFDAPLMAREAKFAGIEFSFPPHIDVFVFVSWHWRAVKSRKLSAIANQFGIRARAGESLHAADVDCEIAGRLLTFMVASGIIPDDVDEALAQQALMSEALQEEERKYGIWFYEDRVTGDLRMGAGKCKGKLVSEVPKKEWDYLINKAYDIPAHVMALFKEFGS